ncbi:hypothetical protein Aph01nite_07760 [Acrocarpospora phusangensis]|uniref:Uncharacterized protein n=1 Tax=Acrocarpospora phusangensis TaxID=1070424 RepID=A0A919Q5D9_9ACTN|nr:hypothetical protein Aph01nite_07760 [Acrocarpospora phusangensis]
MLAVAGAGWLAGAGQAQAATAPDSCLRTAVIGVGNKIANRVTATTGMAAGPRARAAVGTALVAVGRTGVFSALPCDHDPRRRVHRLAAMAGLPGLSMASGVLSVADAAGVAAGSGALALPGLPELTDVAEAGTAGGTVDLSGLPHVPGLPDASALVTLPELPGVPLLPGTPKSPVPNLMLVKGMPGELGGLAAGIPATSGLPAAPAMPVSPAMPAKKLFPPASVLPETASLPATPALPDAFTVTDIAERLLGHALLP